jgi:hypothetical protein
MAATRAASGTATKTPTRTRWSVELGSSSRSGLTLWAGRGWGLAVAVTVPPVVPADAGVAWFALVAPAVVVASAALTVSGKVVIVLLWN